jgi:hypothetical protein
MRLRSVILLLWPVLFLLPSATAQKRVFATVDPNAAALNYGADTYDPTTGTISPLPTGPSLRLKESKGKLNVAREKHIAVRIGDGRVIVAGGYHNRYLKSFEMFNPTTGVFTISDEEMSSTRSGAAAVLMQGGSVLVAGGYNGSYLSSADIFDPTTETFHASSNSMQTARQNPTATRLSDGKALVVGGFNGSFINSAELFDPASSSFIYTSGYMDDAREGHTATLLSDGRVLVTGGCNNSDSSKIICDKYLNTAEIYDPSEDTFSPTGAMNASRSNHTATLLADGKVLITGGTNGTATLATAEIYDPTTGKFTVVSDMGAARMNHTASILPNGTVLIAGGQSDTHLSSAEIFTPAAGSFTTLSTSLSVPRSMHTATVLADGRVLFTGGENGSLLVFDVNYQTPTDNISPNIVFSSDSQTGFVPYTGSGVVVAFSVAAEPVINRIVTGGKPAFMTPLPDGKTMAVVSVLDNKIFIIDMVALSLKSTYSFTGEFGFGSILTLSPDGSTGYISSTSTGEVIKFDVATGKESGRLTGMKAPAQITVTKDGKTLLIVDTSANEVVFADSSSMTSKYKMTPMVGYPTASFTIFNKAVLNLDETQGVIASQDLAVGSTCSGNALFIFTPSTGAIVDIGAVGCTPGFTTLLPTGSYWLVLGRNSMSFVPTWWPANPNVVPISQGETLSSANVVVSPGSKYAFYALASADLVFQQDIGTGAVVGSFAVGDDPNEVMDQASSIAITPNGWALAVLNFASNELNLLVGNSEFRQTKYFSEKDEFTGLSLVNLSNNPVNMAVTLLTNAGEPYASSTTTNSTATTANFPNPYKFTLLPNAQQSLDVATLFNLDTTIVNQGRLFVTSEQPSVAGFSMTGKVRSSFLNTYLSSVFANPFATDYGQTLHNFIIPEIPIPSSTTTATEELSFVNPNYNASFYNVTHYAADGTVMETRTDQAISGSSRETKKVTDLITSSQTGAVVIIGGFDSASTKSTADIFVMGSSIFGSTNGALSKARQGHTATLLQNNKVLVVGGKNGSTILKSAELYTPGNGTFHPPAATMKYERYRHTATLLSNGQVLIAGGQSSKSINRTAEIYDVVDDAFKPTAGLMTSARDAHTATLLNNGKVLIAGGISEIGIASKAELYDQDSSLFQATGRMNVARVFHTAIKLPDGNVLIAGGYNGAYLSSAELYDPSTEVFTTISPMTVERSKHTCTLLSNGTVLIAGGINSSGILNSAEIYDPQFRTFTPTEGPMTATRYSHTATLLNDDTSGKNNNKVLVAGGFGNNSTDADDKDATNDEPHILSSAEYYNPVTKQFVRTSESMTSARQGHTATLLLSDDQGYLRVKSPIGLLLSEIYNVGGASAAVNGLNIDKNVGIKKLYSPQFLITPSFQTYVNIINGNQDNVAILALTLHTSDGQVLSTPLIRTLSANAQIKGSLWDIFNNAPSLLNKSGWFEVSSSADQIVGTLTITNPHDDFRATYELSGSPLSHFVYPLVVEDSLYQTGINLLNTSDQNASVQMELWGPGGTLDASVTIMIAPNMSKSASLTDFFPGMQPHQTGNVRILSSQPLYSFATMYARDMKFISSMAPVRYPE